MVKRSVIIVFIFFLIFSLYANEKGSPFVSDSDSDYVQSSNRVQGTGEYHITFPYQTSEQVKGFVNPERNDGSKTNWYLFYVCIPKVTPSLNNMYGMNIGLPFTEKINNIYGLDLSLSGYSRNMYGIQLSALANNNKNAGGLQFALINSTQEEFYGLEIAASNADNYLGGIQIAAINNIQKYIGGLQLGLINDVIGDIHGAQVGLINVADNIAGMQISVINRAKKTNGFNFQLGVINSNDSGGGLQFGLINYNPKAWLKYCPLINFSF